MEIMRKIVCWVLLGTRYLVINVGVAWLLEAWVFGLLEVWINGHLFGEEEAGGGGGCAGSGEGRGVE